MIFADAGVSGMDFNKATDTGAGAHICGRGACVRGQSGSWALALEAWPFSCLVPNSGPRS